MSPQALFFGATALTAFTDNAALTYLGSLIMGISEEAKYSRSPARWPAVA
jgi:hypothetical protein